jgi:collagenase-like PrtC family protease
MNVGNRGKEICPDIDAAASTQMSVNTYQTIKRRIAKECAVEA